MKSLFLLSIFTFGILLSGCDKEDDNINNSNFEYKATVKSQGLDCGETYIISIESIDSDADIANGNYYADSLDSDLKVEGLIIYLNCRKPNEDELYACTTLGPTYSHVIVTDSKIAED